MVDLRPHFMITSLSPLENAYRAGELPLLKMLDEAEAEFRDHLRLVELGLADDVWIDEDTGQSFDRRDYVLASFRIAHDAIQAHRKAFTLMIHHCWEKHVCDFMQVIRYDANKAYGLLKQDGWKIDIPRLEFLRMASNCIKHDSAEMYDKHPEKFDGEIVLFKAEGLTEKEMRQDTRISKCGYRGRWEEALVLTNDHMADFFDTVRKSAQIMPQTHDGGAIEYEEAFRP